MQSLDLSNSVQQVSSRISAAKTYNDISKSYEKLKRSVGDSASQSAGFIATQLDKVKDYQKRYLKDPPNSLDNLLNFLQQTKGNGSETFKYLKQKVLQTAVRIEPKVVEIITQESIKALGCSQEQTYKGTPAQSLNIQPLPLRPQQEGIYIPVQSVDFFSNLKNSPTSSVGQVYYEKPDPSGGFEFIPFGGEVDFPMNKQLNQIMNSENSGRSLSQILKKDYTGVSGLPLFDVQYTNVNSFGVTGDYFRVLLLDRIDPNSPQTSPLNKVGEMLTDYYSTIKLIDSVSIGAQLVNILSGAVDIKANIGAGEIDNQSKFFLIAQRILGLCFDSRTEIDVSGIAKIAELDGIDESFYEFTESDLRNIDVVINNIKLGIVEFEDCNNVKLPVNSTVLVDQLVEFRNKVSGQTVEQQVATIEKIVDSISQNPDWKIYIPSNVDIKLSIDKNIIKKIPLAVVAGILTPKVLLPIYTLMSVVQSGATYTYNQAVTSANTFIQSGNTLGAEGSNIITGGVEFLKKWKQFTIQIISRINEQFLEILFEELKKDLINLIGLIIRDIQKTKNEEMILMIQRLVGLLIEIGQLITDYRKCKSLIDNILRILNLINSVVGRNQIPAPLLLMTKFLPGTSPQRAFVNVIEELQSVGIPTGTLPDGSPNLMALYQFATQKGLNKEKALNSTLNAFGISPVGPVQIFGKPI